MTKINVATSTKLDEICNLLENNEEVTYKYVCNISNCEITYEVEDHGDHGNLLRYTKNLIRSFISLAKKNMKHFMHMFPIEDEQYRSTFFMHSILLIMYFSITDTQRSQ